MWRYPNDDPLFSRAELANAIHFISREAERVEIYYDPDPPFARVLVCTEGLAAVSEGELAAICGIVRDFIPGHISVEVVTTTAPIVLGRSVGMVLT